MIFFPHNVVLLVFSLLKLLALVSPSSSEFYTMESNKIDKGRWFISSDISSLSKLFSFLTKFLVSSLGCQHLIFWYNINIQFYCYSLCYKHAHTLTHHFLKDYSHKTCHALVASIQIQSALSVQFFCLRLQALVYQLLDELSWAAEGEMSQLLALPCQRPGYVTII